LLARELIEILSFYPDREVEVLTENLVTEITEVATDCFDTEQGMIWLILPDLENA
jgi:hypothetical protein